jgi:subtilisin-like proprotein convertase family protein
MPAVNFNFDIEKESDFIINFIYNGPDGNPIDLSDKCIILSISGSDGSIRRYSSRALADYNTNGWNLTADNNGSIIWRASAAETGSFNFTNAVYDLDVKDIGTIKINNIRISQGSIGLIQRNIALLDSGCPSRLDALEITATPIITTSPGSTQTTPTPTVSDNIDFCLPYDCGPIDLFSTVYNGSGLVLNDLSTTSGSVIVSNTGIISNIELAINKLSHSSPSDLIFLLAPPSGGKVLLSANSKITNFNNNFSFMFSNKASSGIHPHNVPNGQVCNILDKTNIVKYNNENLNSSFNHLFGASLTGVWNFIVADTDPLGSGLIDSWKLIITYDNNIPENTDPFECGIT